MDTQYVKIRSWHVIRPGTVPAPFTLCGLAAAASAETTTTLPAEKSCENCLRILARRTDS